MPTASNSIEETIKFQKNDSWLLRLSTGPLRSIMNAMIRPTNKNIWSHHNRMPNNPHCYTTQSFHSCFSCCTSSSSILNKVWRNAAANGLLGKSGIICGDVSMFVYRKKVWTNSASPAHQKEVLDVCPHNTLWKKIDSWGFLRLVQPFPRASYDLPTCPETPI